ncbi:DUF4255 domain-containing protein [Streptomyces hoynatensis]|uniref:DUF4255 domain-containing protein n=1 Tax=Streptomyces hoynatensis TaxID=1141874 RepID=A0A3A9Z9Q0_9ACTN|nr:DUF4255 domain-containing protein [Streptomyces hoynatensis]RKN44036.1 DUF4255 domain-containing protein [Streptomyces hoynatensis]
MIHEVDEALRALFRAEVMANSPVGIVFEAPTRDWAAKVNAPTIDVYLYDIREDTRRRGRGLLNEYDARGAVVARRRPPTYFTLSYLVTAWTRRPEDEHRLLSAVLSCLLRHDALPAAHLTGALGELGLPVPMTIALPPPSDRSFADVWNALGGELKPSLDLVIGVPVTDSPVFPAGPQVTDEGLRIGLAGLPPTPPPPPFPETAPALPVYGRPPGPPAAGEDGEDPPAPPGRRRGIASRVAEGRGS